MSNELSSRYESREVEARLYPHWETGGFFKPRSDREGKKFQKNRYVIVIPPPNVTGVLHMGHALNNSIQDILTRWNRMQGKDTLWIPGVDHAGIATQNVVEKKLAKEKKSRHDLGRENFLKEVWKWKEDHGSTITRQLRRLGASCDWSRERFTMDEGLSKAVRECFVRLYEKGLIYQGHYIINWCPRCQTALSDEESMHKEVQGGFYHIKYPIAGKGKAAEKIGDDHIVVATTRPETMLGDTAVAIHPEDGRYKSLIGKKVILPLLNREIPVIADAQVDPEFGTGIVKVTPAHDPNDFEMGNRHGLPQINVMYPDGKINENGGPYQGLDRFVARKKVIEDLEAQGLFVKRDSHTHAVGHCYRCDTVVEPYLSKQWFVKMKPLAEKALKAHAQGKTKFYPDRWTKVYTNWLEGIRDWCISRQIWWGHQIPVWYCDNCKTQEARGKKSEERNHRKGIIVSRETPKKCPDCGNAEIWQDPDVLDTWFSSWLWPFSTLGWPQKTEDLQYFYPTSDLVTAAEIIFFWVARMIMAGLEFMEEVPFSRIYIHGTVRAQSGIKMSKSLGNAIDPLEVIDEMGADALRFSMIMLSAQDVYLSREKFEVGRNFTNKLWNASRFVLMNMADFSKGSKDLKVKAADLPLSSRWILSRLDQTIEETHQYLSEFATAQAASGLYHFVWDDFCDWFIELAKPDLMQEDAIKTKTQQTLFFILEKILKLLHPFMPFVTEEIWIKMKSMAEDGKAWPESLSFAEYPKTDGFRDKQVETLFTALQDAVSGFRNLRMHLNLDPSKELDGIICVRESAMESVFQNFQKAVEKLARVKLRIDSKFKKSPDFVGAAFPAFEIFVCIEGLLDKQKEQARISKKIEECQQRIAAISQKLSNEDFVKNAPSAIVEKEKEKLTDLEKVLGAQKELLSIFR